MVGRRFVVPTLVLVVILPGPGAAQTAEDFERRDRPGVLGSVVDRETRRPLGGVAVTLEAVADSVDRVGSPLPSTVTDDEGRFYLPEVEDGIYRLEVERLGYGTVVDSVAFHTDLGLRIEVEMVAEAVELDPLLVVTSARSQSLATNGFYDRRRRGIGRFVSRPEIARGAGGRVSDLFRTMPGVRLSSYRFNDVGVILLRSGCVADVILDGVRTVNPFPVDALLTLDHIAGVEVYQASEVPPSFGPSSCGAVVIWTYVPNPGSGGRPWSWTKFLGATGIFGVLILLTR